MADGVRIFPRCRTGRPCSLGALVFPLPLDLLIDPQDLIRAVPRLLVKLLKEKIFLINAFNDRTVFCGETGYLRNAG